MVSLRDATRSSASPSDELEFVEFCRQHLSQSSAQLLQDLFVLHQTGQRREGYFVEFGATDGVNISNTVLLEREYGWTGALAEPARYWQEALHANRRCAISTDCIWHSSGQMLAFNETPDREYSTLDHLSTGDWHAARRTQGLRYNVPTLSLNDWLERLDAPQQIDYLSIDTEGSEFDILNAFDFTRRHIHIITVEHNFTPSREGIQTLMARNGYQRKFEQFSRWDDWYVKG